MKEDSKVAVKEDNAAVVKVDSKAAVKEDGEAVVKVDSKAAVKEDSETVVKEDSEATVNEDSGVSVKKEGLKSRPCTLGLKWLRRRTENYKEPEECFNPFIQGTPPLPR